MTPGAGAATVSPVASVTDVDCLPQPPVSALRRAALWALTRWETFPVGAEPRPVVLCEPPVHVDGGFVDQAASAAFWAGALVGTDLLPEEARALLPGAVGGWDSTAAHQADGTQVLQVTAARRAERRWRTDRGLALLPGWQLTLTGAVGPVWLLDVAASGCWRPPAACCAAPAGAAGRQVRARVERDGTTVHLSLLVPEPSAAGSGGCDFIASPTAVVALPAGGPTPPEGPRLVAYQPFDGYRVELVGQLAEPLGQRVVVDLDGSPVVVEHAGGPQRR